MKQLLLLITGLIICQTMAFSQPSLLSGEIRKPRQNSFYSRTHFTNDRLPPDLGEKPRAGGKPTPRQKFIKNSNNSIVNNIDNPNGTLVVDADIAEADLASLAQDPSKIIFKEDYAEIGFLKDNTVYRIPIFNETKLNLEDKLVINECNLTIRNCVTTRHEIPASATLTHKIADDYCHLLAYKSISNLFPVPYYQSRLNLSCVFLLEKLKDFYCHIHRSQYENMSD